MLRLAKWLILILFANNAAAKCNFPSANFISELSSPKNIKSIEIETPKSRQFNKNFVKILLSKQNIPSDLKSSFDSNVTVNYQFGKCSYKGSIKQHGDWKDHIKLENGNPLRSLKVSLNNGNILNAVKFKLLIPETRGDLNEVLGTVLLRELGFIVPETFQVQTKINNIKTVMLFQEETRKELLERNKKREGPILEGDESMLWSYKNFDAIALEPLSLSRVKNEKWFLKGENSQKITLNAYSKLQQVYLDYTHHIDKRKLAVMLPKDRDDKKFNNYFILLMAMDGLHGLRPHNRQFYYDIFSQKLEPIYYDGNLSFNNEVIIDESILKLIKGNKVDQELAAKLSTFKSSQNIFSEFYKRVLVKKKDATEFYNIALQNILKNTFAIIKKLETLQDLKTTNISFDDQIYKYTDFETQNNIDQIIVTEIRYSNQNYLAKTLNNEEFTLTINEAAELISNNKLGQKRVVYIPKTQNTNSMQIMKKNFPEISGEILHSNGLKISMNKKKKEITFEQNNEFDWILLRDFNLKEWNINFIGIVPNENIITNEQRFNTFGMTGCLNIYNSFFKNTIIKAVHGACEDSVNIVDSKGNLKNIDVKNAYSDAVDIDFSEINIDKIDVNKAGNDCLDVSGGNYKIKKVKMVSCGDKGISVGEKSTLSSNDTNISFAKIAISSKDFSKTNINKANYKNVEYCYEAKQKKIEFGGALLKFDSLLCNEKYIVDENSRVEIK